MKLKYPLVLGSSSPRRQYLVKEAGFEFDLAKPDVEELFPHEMPATEVASFLAEKKADYFAPVTQAIILTADTVVIHGSQILNKPGNRDEAIDMLKQLSGNKHLVMTGVCIYSPEEKIVFADTTEVTFNKLYMEEIEFYVDNYKPFDKAGAYGAQDWIGMVAIKEISGSYFNVMGLPIHLVYQQLRKYSLVLS